MPRQESVHRKPSHLQQISLDEAKGFDVGARSPDRKDLYLYDAQRRIYWCALQGCHFARPKSHPVVTHFLQTHLGHRYPHRKELCDKCDLFIASFQRRGHDLTHTPSEDRPLACRYGCGTAWISESGGNSAHMRKACPLRPTRPRDLYGRNWDPSLKKFVPAEPSGSARASHTPGALVEEAQPQAFSPSHSAAEASACSPTANSFTQAHDPPYSLELVGTMGPASNLAGFPPNDAEHPDLAGFFNADAGHSPPLRPASSFDPPMPVDSLGYVSDSYLNPANDYGLDYYATPPVQNSMQHATDAVPVGRQRQSSSHQFHPYRRGSDRVSVFNTFPSSTRGHEPPTQFNPHAPYLSRTDPCPTCLRPFPQEHGQHLSLLGPDPIDPYHHGSIDHFQPLPNAGPPHLAYPPPPHQLQIHPVARPTPHHFPPSYHFGPNHDPYHPPPPPPYRWVPGYWRPE